MRIDLRTVIALSLKAVEYGVSKRIHSKNPPYHRKVQVGKDQEKAQSEKDSHSKNRGGKKPN